MSETELALTVRGAVDTAEKTRSMMALEMVAPFVVKDPLIRRGEVKGARVAQRSSCVPEKTTGRRHHDCDVFSEINDSGHWVKMDKCAVLSSQSVEMMRLEVAHEIPHSLAMTQGTEDAL